MLAPRNLIKQAIDEQVESELKKLAEGIYYYTKNDRADR